MSNGEKEKCEQKKIVGYTRLSQVSDISIPAQHDDIKQEVEKSEELNEYELEKIFNEGQRESGFDETREKFNEMLEYVYNNNDVVGVIVRDLSRLSRDRFNRLKILIEFREEDKILYSIEDDGIIDIEEEYGLVIQTVKGTADDVKKRKEINRSKRVIKERKEKGYYQGKPPFGFQFDEVGHFLVKDVEEFKKVQQILKLRDKNKTLKEIEEETEVPYSTVSDILNRREIYENPTKHEKYRKS